VFPSHRPAATPADGAQDDDVDGWLVGKAVEGDADAFEALVRRHRVRIYRIALRIVGNSDDAQDVTQDVLIQLWGSLAGFLGGSAFSTWLYRMVVNRSLNHRTRGTRTTSLLEGDRPDGNGPRENAGPAEVVIARERAAATAAAIAALPAEQRSVFVLHQMEGFSYAEVAVILKVPESTVRGRLARGRRTLLDQLKDWA
jgi:RNA polymerase sigma-70 factor (ECF subfamily)